MTKLNYLLVSLLLFAGTIWAQDPSGNLTHSWTFEGENAADMVGAADGILSGNAAIATTSLGDKGAVLTGGSVDLDAATIAINTYEELSLEAWFTPDGTQAGTFTMVAYLGGTQGGLAYSGFQIQPTRGDGVGRGAISCLNNTNPWTTENGVNTAAELAASQLYHAVVTINSDVISFYVDGVFIGEDSLTGDNSIANLSNDFAWIGKGGYTGDASWQGTVHEVNIYDKALDAAEVSFLNTGGVTTGTGVVYQQSSDSLGLVVIPAEEFTINKAGTGSKDGDSWAFGSDTAGYFGDGYMQSVMLGGGDGSTTNAETVNAKLTYDVEFVKTGSHYVFAHVYYPSSNNDSFWYGLNGSTDSGNGRMDQSNWGNWIWDEGNNSFDVPAAGLHTFDIMQREPDAIVDMIILTSNPNFDPATYEWQSYVPYEVVFVTPSDSSFDMPVVEAIEAYTGDATYNVTLLEKSVIDNSDLAMLNAADVVVMGRNIGSADVAAAEEVWDAVERPVLTMNMWGLRENRANWVPAGIGCENINGDTLVVNGIIQNSDAVFGGLTDTITWWNGSFSSFVPDSARVAAGNGTLMVESEDYRPLFMRWKANLEYYPGAGHAPSHMRSFIGMGNDNNDPANYFGFSEDAEMIFFNELKMLAGQGDAGDYSVVFVTPSDSSFDAPVIEEIEAYNNGETFGVTILAKGVIDSTDLGLLNAADVVVMGRNIGSADVAAAEGVWDAVERPVLTMNMWGLRENRANWVPAGIGCENINGDTLVVNGIIQNDDAVFGGLTDTINWWNGSFSSFVVDSARIASGNGTLMVESEDLRPLFMRWKANTEYYPGAGHAPSHVRSFMGMGNDNDDPANYFGFSEEAGMVFFNELMMLAGMGDAPQYSVAFVTPSDSSFDAPVVAEIEGYNNGETFAVTLLEKSVIDSTDLLMLNGFDVVVMGRNIGSGDIGAAADIWDAIERPVMAMGLWGLRENRANWVPAGIGCENINGDTLVVNGIIQNTDAVFGGLTDTITWWTGSYSAFVPDSARIAAGNGTLMVESEDLRPLFIRWNAYEEFYEGAGHEPKHIRSYMGLGNDNADPANYFGFSEESGMVFFNELMMLAGQGVAADTTTDTTTNIVAPTGYEVKLYPNPVNDYVNIVSEVNIQNIRVMNMMGAALRVEEINAKETVLDMTDFTSGVYIIMVEGQQGTQVFKLRKL